MFVFYIHTVPYMFGSINASCTANRMCTTQTYMYDGILMEVHKLRGNPGNVYKNNVLLVNDKSISDLRNLFSSYQIIIPYIRVRTCFQDFENEMDEI
jgi:hypothetical protein